MMKKIIVIMMVAVFSVTAAVALPTTITGMPELCTITIKGDIDGKPVNVSVTFQAENCAVGAARFFKELMGKK